MKELIAELPMADAKESAEIVRNWSNDKAFQIGMHVVRGNLSPAEAQTALSNLAEASITTVLAAVEADVVDRRGPSDGGVAAIALGDLASREAFPGVAIRMLFVHDTDETDHLCRRFCEAVSDLAEDSLLFSPIPRDHLLALPLSELAEHCVHVSADEVPVLARARCMFECGDSEIGQRFLEARGDVLAEGNENATLGVQLRELAESPTETGVSTYVGMRGGLNDVEKAARFLQLTKGRVSLEDSAPTAASVFKEAGAEPLAQAAMLLRDLQGILRLVGDEGFDVDAAGLKVRSLVASACGCEDFDSLNSTVAEAASRATDQIDSLVAHA